MDEREKVDPLKELGERLDRARRAQQSSAKRAAPETGTNAALAFAWRIGVELVGALVVAIFLGWAVDRWLGTRPWGMIVFFFLGIAAGMLNVYRAVSGLGMKVGYRRDRGVGNAGENEAGQEEDED